MTLSAIMFLLALIAFLLALFGVTLGSVSLIPLGLALTAAGLLFGATTWNRTVG